jgi:hypothetical protein
VEVVISVCTKFLKFLLVADEKQPFLICGKVIQKLSIATSRRRTSLWITTIMFVVLKITQNDIITLSCSFHVVGLIASTHVADFRAGHTKHACNGNF